MVGLGSPGLQGVVRDSGSCQCRSLRWLQGRRRGAQHRQGGRRAHRVWVEARLGAEAQVQVAVLGVGWRNVSPCINCCNAASTPR